MKLSARYTGPSMRSVTVALVVVLFAGDLRAQISAQEVNDVLESVFADICAATDSDEHSEAAAEIGKEAAASAFNVSNTWALTPPCKKATGTGPQGVKGSLRKSGSAGPLAASGANPDHLWILSDTPPDTAPATDDAVYVVDPNTFETVATILTPGPIPLAIAAGNTGNWVYATIQGVPAGENGVPAHAPLVEVISTSTLSIAQTINLPQSVNPWRPSSSPEDRYLYVPSTSSGQLLIIDTESPSSIVTVPLTITARSGQLAAPGATNTAITPDGELLFVLCGPGICVVDTTTQQQTAYIGYGANLETLSDLAIDPTGSRLYVAGQTYVYAYDTATLMQIGSALTKTGVQLNNIGISSDGLIVLASDTNSNTIFVINPVSLAVSEIDLPAPPPFPSGESPTFIMTVLP